MTKVVNGLGDAPTAPCRLCGQTAVLQHSHIIPEFQYAPLYDSLHRFSVMSSDSAKPVKWAQKGVREFLLCHACEQKLADWERYAQQVIFEDRLYLVRRLPEGLLLGGIDYRRFRLFLLSLLWRMGVSSLPLFEDVELGEHEEPLRRALLTEDPGALNEYPCMLVGVTMNRQFQPDLILQPDMIELDGTKQCRAVIAGVLYVFSLGTGPIPFGDANFTVNPAGTLFMAVRDASQIEFVYEALRQQHAAMEKRATRERR